MNVGRIVNFTGLSNDTKVLDSFDREVHGIAAIDFDTIAPGGLVACTIRLDMMRFEVEPKTTSFALIDPRTGKLEAVKRIEFVNAEPLDLPC